MRIQISFSKLSAQTSTSQKLSSKYLYHSSLNRIPWDSKHRPEEHLLFSSISLNDTDFQLNQPLGSGAVKN